MFLIVSTLVLIIIAAGLFFRKDPKKHIPLMLTAFIIDVSLVLVIEFQRHAVEAVVENVVKSPSAFVIFHASISLLVIIMYIALTWTGTTIYKHGARHLLKLHRAFAAIFIILRLINYITSFSISEKITL